MLSRAAIARVTLVAAGLASVATDKAAPVVLAAQEWGPRLEVVQGEITTARLRLDTTDEDSVWPLAVQVNPRRRGLNDPEVRLRVYEVATGERLYDDAAEIHDFLHDLSGGAELVLELEVESVPRAEVDCYAYVQGTAPPGEVTLTLESP